MPLSLSLSHAVRRVCAGVGRHRMTRQPRGGTAVLLDAMRAHPRAGELQQHACTALANVLSRSRGASASSSSSSSSFQAQALATAAMRAHAGDSNVQWSACVLLLSLQDAARSFSPSVQGTDIRECVAEAMRVHPHDVVGRPSPSCLAGRLTGICYLSRYWWCDAASLVTKPKEGTAAGSRAYKRRGQSSWRAWISPEANPRG
jgi:hypothetical protein